MQVHHLLIPQPLSAEEKNAIYLLPVYQGPVICMSGNNPRWPYFVGG